MREGEGVAFPFLWAIDGTRTRDIRDHNAALYQLSYDRRYRITARGV